MTEPAQDAVVAPSDAKTPSTESAAARDAVMAQDVSTLATGAGISLAGKLLGRGIHIGGQIVLARLLGPATFGLYVIGWTLLRILGAIAPLGLDRGVIRFAPQYRHSSPAALRGVLLQSLGMALTAGALLGVVFYLAAPWLAARVFNEPDLVPILRLFAVALPLYAGLRVAAAATRVTQRMQFSALAEELTPPVGNLLLILLFYAVGWHLLGAVAAAVISFGLAFALSLYYVRRLFPEVRAPRLRSTWFGRDLLAFSLPASLAGTFTMLTLWVDRLLVAYFRPAADVGIYQAASQSALLFAVILTGFNAVFAPMIADLYYRGEHARLEELFRVSTKWTLYLCVPLFLVLVAAPGPIVAVVFGPDYAEGWLALLILSTAQLVNAATGAVALLLIMTGYQNRVFFISLLAFGTNVLLNGLLIPHWGIDGAAVATAVAVSGFYLALLFDVRRSLRLWPYDRRYLKGLLATIVALAAVLSVKSWAGGLIGSLLGLTMLTVISIGVFAIALLFSGLDAEDHNVARMLRARFADMGRTEAPSSERDDHWTAPTP